MILKRIGNGTEWVLSVDELAYRYRASNYARSGESASRSVKAFVENANGLHSKLGAADYRTLAEAVVSIGLATAVDDLCECGRRLWYSMGRGEFHVITPCVRHPAYNLAGIVEHQPA